MKHLLSIIVWFSIILNNYAQITDVVTLNQSLLQFENKNSYQQVKIPGYMLTEEPGMPELPVKTFSYFIPEGTKVVTLVINSISEETLADNYAIYPAQESQTLSSIGDTRFTEPDLGVYNTDVFYPDQNTTMTATLFKMGAGICGVNFYPIRYNPVTQKLKMVTYIEFMLVLESNTEQAIKPLRMSLQSFKHIKKGLKALVENPSDVDANYTLSSIYDFSNSENFHPAQRPSLEGSPVDYVVITTEEFKDDFATMVDFKTKKGTPACVRTTEWIYSSYPGADRQEQIRNFIIDAYTKWGTLWFTMGGDVDVVPIRYVWHSHFNQSQLVVTDPDGLFIPTDMYYACLDGNWNADGDITFGEANWDRENDGSFVNTNNYNANLDQVDRLLDVYIGRIGIETHEELARFNTKYFEYVTTSNGHENNALLFSADSNGVSSYYMNSVGNNFGANVNITKLYENTGHTSTDVLNTMNAGNNTILCGYGHGGAFGFEACLGSLNNDDMGNLQNTDRNSILLIHIVKLYRGIRIV